MSKQPYMSNTYPDLVLRAKMAAPPPLLVPAVATIVMAISKLKKKKKPALNFYNGLLPGSPVLLATSHASFHIRFP